MNPNKASLGLIGSGIVRVTLVNGKAIASPSLVWVYTGEGRVGVKTVEKTIEQKGYEKCHDNFLLAIEGLKGLGYRLIRTEERDGTRMLYARD
ncbi:MAG: hypothetical protein NT120_05285 [Candidatus Aenigmarchaeota archaeon]|nr:hypothetical protein [Candidatus Aenigmarchaeota archaeon]